MTVFTKEERQSYIGSSDIAAVMGLSRWKTPLHLWAEKTGRLEPFETSEAAEWGTRLEATVAKKFSETHEGAKLIAYKKRFIHKDYPYLSCELDRIIAGTDEMVEVKTCHYTKAKEFDGEEIPIEFVLQVNFAMGLSGRSKAWIAILLGGQRYLEKELTFNEELYDRQILAAVKFWEEFVGKNQPPMAMSQDADTLLELFPNGSAEILEVSDKEKSDLLDSALERRNELIVEKKAIEAEQDKIESQIKQVIGELGGIKTPKFKVTWTPTSRTLVDREKLEEDGILAQYSKLSVTRVLRVTSANGKGGAKK